MAAYATFQSTQLDALCRSLADAMTHKQLTLLLRDAGIAEDVPNDRSNPRWKRMLCALSQRQEQDKCSNAVLAFLVKVLHPQRFRDRQQEFAEFREKANFHLSFAGLNVGDDGQLRPVPKAQTISEAEQRASDIAHELRRRAVHHDVLEFCRPELMQQNYFHCVLEATKSLAAKIREKTDLRSDGADLVRAAFSVKKPLLALNSLQTETEQSDQKGFANLLTGIFGTFRNVPAHAPKLHWAINRQDALDALTIISYAHRRLDQAAVVPTGAGFDLCL